ncbi:MAG: TetR/AcrR family transcriptional regulator [Actinomycetota bacterium]
MQEAAPPIDGRTLRALRTREAIVDATIAQIDEGDLRPTAPRVAERAGVSVRSIFQHFADLESLHAAVAERLAVRLTALVLPIAPDLPLDERIERFVRQRGTLLDAVTPIRRAAAVHGPFSEEIQARLHEGQRFLRAELEVAFGPELDRHDDSEVLDALDAACSWGTWDHLRTGLGRSPEEAARIVGRLVHALLV